MSRYIHLTEEIDNLQDELLSTVQDIEFWIGKIQRGTEVVSDTYLLEKAKRHANWALSELLDSLEINDDGV